MPRFIRNCCLISFVLYFIGMGILWADAVPEYELKAAFLYKFAQFTTWPTAALNLTFCVYGDDPFVGALDKLQGKILRDMPLLIKHPATLEAVKQCQIVFFNPSNQHELTQWVNALHDQPILTLSDVPGAWDSGVMIVLVTEPNRLGFRINHTAAEQVGLRFGAQLLQLAKEIR